MYEIFEQLLLLNNTTAYQVSKATGISQSTLSDWKNGKITPKADKLQLIADHFNVSLEYLLGKEKSEQEYYLNDETAEIANQIFHNKELRMLFDASRKANPDDLKLIIEMVKRFKGNEE
ncbi:MAG: hypothetical protein K0Q87_4525 [Neobacillus sp.]|nr:hypothetical protein [Neobacillus sp.]